MKRILAAVLAMMVALAGCSGSEEPEQTASSSTTTTSPPPRIPGVEGRFLSLAGENYFDAGLYELRLWPVRLDPLTSVRRVSSIGACETRVVVAAAQAEVGYADRLQVFSGGRFGPVDNLGSPHALSRSSLRLPHALYLPPLVRPAGSRPIALVLGCGELDGLRTPARGCDHLPPARHRRAP